MRVISVFYVGSDRKTSAVQSSGDHARRYRQLAGNSQKERQQTHVNFIELDFRDDVGIDRKVDAYARGVCNDVHCVLGEKYVDGSSLIS